MNQAQQLRDGIQALGLDIDDAKQAKLLDYAALLQKWNKTYNLTALRDPAQTVSPSSARQPDPPALYRTRTNHARRRFRRRTARHTHRHLPPPTLTSPSSMPTPKKTAFLQQAVIRTRPLKNVRVISGRVEAAADCPRPTSSPPRLCRTRRLRQLDRAPPQRRRLLGGHERRIPTRRNRQTARKRRRRKSRSIARPPTQCRTPYRHHPQKAV